MDKILNEKVTDNDNTTISENNKKQLTPKQKKMLGISYIIIGVIVIGGIIVNIADAFSGSGGGNYYDCIELSDSSETGATFNISYNEVKSIIGSDLSIGDANSSSGGWNQISSSSTYKEYNIVSTSGVWGVNVVVDSNDKVISVACKTVGIDNGEPNDSEIESFASTFAEIIGSTEESTESTLKNLYNSGTQVRNYEQGVYMAYQKTDSYCCFVITAMSEEQWDSIQ